jgi:hypothetical protein
MIGLGDWPDRVDGAAHLQGLPSSIGQGEIHRSTGAVGRRSGRVQAGWGPKAPHIKAHRFPFGSRTIGIQAPRLTLLADGVVHHEGLNSHRPPGVENRQLVWALAALQTSLDASQATHHTPAQAEGTGLVTVGSPQAEIGVGL